MFRFAFIHWTYCLLVPGIKMGKVKETMKYQRKEMEEGEVEENDTWEPLRPSQG